MPIPLGGLFSLLVLLPNLLVVFFPPLEAPPAGGEKSGQERLMGVVERAGQLAAFILPFFYAIEIDEEAIFSLVIMLLALSFYYAGWARYMLGGRKYSLLFKPMLGFPLPMAVCPVIFFLSASFVLHSVYLGAAALVLAAGHIYVSYLELRKVEAS